MLTVMRPATGALLTWTLLFAAVIELNAQTGTPHIGYAYPAGGRQGTTFQVKIGGQFLDGATNAYFSSPGLHASVSNYVKPLTPKQLNDLREQLRELQQKRQSAFSGNAGRRGRVTDTNSSKANWTSEDQKRIAEIRRKLATFQRRPANPAIGEIVTLQVTIGADAAPGAHELRLHTARGLSNPLVFCVGQLPEFRKPQPIEPDRPLNRLAFRNNNEPKAVPPTEMNVTLPAVVNGQILQGGVDRFRFRARQGQHLVAAVSARQLIPYLADAVPGWFQAVVALYDSRGQELAFAGDYRFHPDPVLFVEIRRDGEYVLEIHDSIYRGRDDFVYRITVGELPFVTSSFPLGGKLGEKTAVELKGSNLPVTTFTQDNARKAPGIYWIADINQTRWLNCAPFAVDSLSEVREREPNDALTNAQSVSPPITVNGRIDHPGDRDIFAFKGNAGDPIVAEVYARRLDSPLDSVLKVTDTAGRQVAFNDDHEDKGCGLNTHHADSYLSLSLPQTGTYYVHVGDAQRQGGAEYAYRLRLSPPRPDFELRVVPSSINVPRGVNALLTVYALRKDGFTNEIVLALDHAPDGFAVEGAKIPANQDQVRVTLRVPFRVGGEPVSLSFEGRAFIQGRLVTHPAVPADDVMEAFAYRHFVPARELKVMLIANRRAARSNR